MPSPNPHRTHVRNRSGGSTLLSPSTAGSFTALSSSNGESPIQPTTPKSFPSITFTSPSSPQRGENEKDNNANRGKNNGGLASPIAEEFTASSSSYSPRLDGDRRRIASPTGVETTLSNSSWSHEPSSSIHGYNNDSSHNTYNQPSLPLISPTGKSNGFGRGFVYDGLDDDEERRYKETSKWSQLKRKFRRAWLSNPTRKRRVQMGLLTLILYLLFIRPFFSLAPPGWKSSFKSPSSSPRSSYQSDTDRDPFEEFPLYNPKDVETYTPPHARNSRSGSGGWRTGSKKAQAQAPIQGSRHGNGNEPNGDHRIVNGLMTVDTDSERHPIHQLIEESRILWTEKVNRQSRSLALAASNYQGRYGRPPPRGFEKWWHYVVKHNITLPDEYDQLNRDLFYYRALSPQIINDKIEMASELPHTFTFDVHDGVVSQTSMYDTEAYPDGDERVKSQLNVLQSVVKDLPDMKIIFTVDDAPQTFSSFSYRNKLVYLVEAGNYVSEDSVEDVSGWSAACTFSAPGRKFNYYNNPDTTTIHPIKTFISSLESLLDLCNHPYQVPLHGVLAYKKPKAETLSPAIAFSKSVFHSDIIAVAPESWIDDSQVPDIPWSSKNHDKLLWRGENTGLHYNKNIPWRDSHRVRLVRDFAAVDNPKQKEHQNEMVKVLPPGQADYGLLGKKEQEISRKKANEYYMDVGFTGNPVQCNHDDGTCADLAEELRFNTLRMNLATQAQHKYILDVDGDAWSTQFEQLLLTGSLIFKSTVMPEWWSERIQPWVHYVPIQVDYSDVYDTIAFFRGDTSGKGGDEQLAQEIADAGKEWARTQYRKEDMTAYMFRLYLEWARLVSPNRKEMNFKYHPSMELRRD